MPAGMKHSNKGPPLLFTVQLSVLGQDGTPGVVWGLHLSFYHSSPGVLWYLNLLRLPGGVQRHTLNHFGVQTLTKLF